MFFQVLASLYIADQTVGLVCNIKACTHINTPIKDPTSLFLVPEVTPALQVVPNLPRYKLGVLISVAY
jgi:hypothetical protein